MPVKTLHRQGLALLTCGLKCKPVVGRLMPHTSQPSNGPHTSLLSSKPRCSLPLLPSFLDKERWGGGGRNRSCKGIEQIPRYCHQLHHISIPGVHKRQVVG